MKVENYKQTMQFGMTPQQAVKVGRLLKEVGGQDSFESVSRIVDLAKIKKLDFANLGSQDAMDSALELEF